MMKKQSNKNCHRFSMQGTASKYPSEFRQWHFRDWREKKAIMRAFSYIPNGARVLDIPCGSGRLTRMLIQSGFSVTSADRSGEMLKIAQENYKNYEPHLTEQHSQAQFFQEDIITGTNFSDSEFDAVICHRLFHHLVHPHVRSLAIKELKRISKDLILFSFFNSFSLSAGIRLVKNSIKRHNQTDRIPINKKTIISELESENLKVLKIISAVWGISPMCIVVAAKSQL